ncbi:MAG: hypothetical protein COU22_03505 [Candidatus Komeilibacteria bacterium CG10_big_fil_rev_8_21_14_0_10_41_13]|uniref:Uncharacterized protein n=1 Tax=Candidatus Komeilibacteria bacterium CG10_big_fil_rev_8_21_14_0_10_41_13 TaxID=1974476 RepID=A0A2M6WBZ4_9BACT|nr:MAG: hypothetical protein COU22_03505 [Candidatus Komeilibacteria bacterium CG10_big_fil_rev_8_21_14_0_10_41_13]
MELNIIFKIIASLGVALITVGILINKKRPENILYILGGLCLTAYSIFINDWIFIVLQIIFVLAAAYDFIKSGKAN